MSSEPNTTSSTFGVTEAFWVVLLVAAVLVPFSEPASRAIGSESTRWQLVYMLVGYDERREVGHGVGKVDATRRHVLVLTSRAPARCRNNTTNPQRLSCLNILTPN
jgi:hypothetical protein